MKKVISLMFIVLIVISLLGCGSITDRKKLCEGVWVSRDEEKHVWYGIHRHFLSVSVYNFSNNGSFTYLHTFNSDYGEFKEYRYSGKYKIKDKMIELTYDANEDGEQLEPETIPYYINEYTQELIFDTNQKGDSDWFNADEEAYSNPNPTLFMLPENWN